jgi:RNA polymerase I-specific transcription initiation factor RRN11
MHSDKRTTATRFLFASPGRRGSSSARRVHLRRLCDILHLSIQRGDLPLAQRSFALLARCEDIECAAIWKFGLTILAAADPDQPPGHDILGTPKHIEFLRVMMLRHPEEVCTSVVIPVSSIVLPTLTHLFHWQRESLVRELVLSLAMAGRERDALDELELCGSPSLT